MMDSQYHSTEVVEQQHRQQREQYYHQQYQQHYDENSVAPLFSKNPPPNPSRGSMRPPSSVYSQSSTTNSPFPPQQQNQRPEQYRQMHHQHEQYQQHPQTYNTYKAHSKSRNIDGVSPESSPELGPVTPVYQGRPPTPPGVETHSHFNMSQSQPQAQVQPGPRTDSRLAGANRSNIPMLRRERRQNQDVAVRTLHETKSKELLRQQQQRQADLTSQRGYKGGEVRWDPRTGELTTSNKGRPSQVKPAEYAKGLGITDNEPASPTASIHEVKPAASSALPSLASRLKRPAQGAGPAPALPAKTQQAPQTTIPETSPASPASPVSPLAIQPAAAPREPLSSRQQSPAAINVPSSEKDPAANAYTSDRPAWQGPSGRTALVAPVRDTRDVAPLNIPRKSSKRVASSSRLRTDASSPLSAAPNSRTMMANPPLSSSPPENETLRTEPAPSQAVLSGEQNPVPTPQNGPSKQAQQPFSSPPPNPSPAQSYPSPPLSGGPAGKRISTIKRKPTPSHHALGSFDGDDPFNYNNRIAPASSLTPSPKPPKLPAHEPEWVQPPSRFSVTTYASTTRESLSEFDPRDIPDMPTLPNSLNPSPYTNQDEHFNQLYIHDQAVQPLYTKSNTGTVSDSVMDRQRPLVMSRGSPKPTPGNEPVVISLKTPWMSGNRSGHLGDDYRVSTSSSSSGEDSSGTMQPNRHITDPRITAVRAGSPSGLSMAGSVHKMLPPVPPEVAAKDRVAMLNAQLAGLAQRRFNIDRGIKQMTELMPMDNLLASADVLYKREQEKRKVQGLRMEMSEIQREEYEIGLKLHRAYKRLDRNAEYEPTTLWVRRVTG